MFCTASTHGLRKLLFVGNDVLDTEQAWFGNFLTQAKTSQ